MRRAPTRFALAFALPLLAGCGAGGAAAPCPAAAPSTGAPVGATSPAPAQGEVRTATLASLAWKAAPGMPPGVETSLVYGDPKTGPFVVMMKIPAGARVPPHWHSADEVAAVVSGATLMGRGETIDEAAGQLVEAGGHALIPAKAPHWAIAKSDTLLVRYASGAGDMHLTGAGAQR